MLNRNLYTSTHAEHKNNPRWVHFHVRCVYDEQRWESDEGRGWAAMPSPRNGAFFLFLLTSIDTNYSKQEIVHFEHESHPRWCVFVFDALLHRPSTKTTHVGCIFVLRLREVNRATHMVRFVFLLIFIDINY